MRGFAAWFGLLGIGGCVDGDADFDGVPYRSNICARTSPKCKYSIGELHAQPIQFSSPRFFTGEERENARKISSMLAFEADLPEDQNEYPSDLPASRFEPCRSESRSRLRRSAGRCDFYPFFTTTETQHGCRWRLGGPYLPHTVRESAAAQRRNTGVFWRSHIPAVLAACRPSGTTISVVYCRKIRVRRVHTTTDNGHQRPGRQRQCSRTRRLIGRPTSVAGIE